MRCYIAPRGEVRSTSAWESSAYSGPLTLHAELRQSVTQNGTKSIIVDDADLGHWRCAKVLNGHP